MINQAARFNFGFASNMVYLLWCVCGGFLLHMLESNYLTILLTPTYEKPVDTPEDIIDMGLTILYNSGSEGMRNAMLNSDNKLDRDLAARTYVSKVNF